MSKVRILSTTGTLVDVPWDDATISFPTDGRVIVRLGGSSFEADPKLLTKQRAIAIEALFSSHVDASTPGNLIYRSHAADLDDFSLIDNTAIVDPNDTFKVAPPKEGRTGEAAQDVAELIQAVIQVKMPA